MSAQPLSDGAEEILDVSRPKVSVEESVFEALVMRVKFVQKQSTALQCKYSFAYAK